MRMGWRAGWVLLLGCWAGGPVAQAGDAVAEALMERVRASMPGVPLELKATIRSLDPNGRPLSKVRAEALLTPSENGRTTRYTLFDAFGSVAEEMTVALGGEQSEFSYAQGDPPAAAPLPDLFGPVAGTEISWMDLSFSYFWWPDPRIIATEKVANRWDCQVIEIACPVETGQGWSHVRLWVAPAYHAVVRGEAWKAGRALKRFEVKSVKKLRKVYMIGDMEVRNLQTGARARLKVGRMKMLSPEYTPEELEKIHAPMEW